jgi:hypothetical protein
MYDFVFPFLLSFVLLTPAIKLTLNKEVLKPSSFRIYTFEVRECQLFITLRALPGLDH